MNTATATRRKSKPPTASAPEQFRGNAPRVSSDQVTVIPLGLIDRHPLNRVIDSGSDEIRQLAESIAEHGQLEPMRVRRMGDRYQLISGERRYHALTLAQSYGAKCIVVECDDSTALKEVAAANSNRQDLNPVERGELMQLLMKPTDEGGSGLSLVEAGAIFGLSSESGCKNALRLMKLPKSILELVIKGDLPERQARKLIPYVDAKPIIEDIAKSLTSHDHYTRLEILTALADDGPFTLSLYELGQLARPISPDIERSNPYPMGSHPCLFDWQENENKLQIVEIPTDCGYDQKLKRDKVEPRKWAMNVKLWDKLQQPFLDRIEKDGESKSKSSKSDSKSKAEPKAKLTPAQLAADAKRRAAEADKRLATFTRDWLQRLMRCAIAERSIDITLVARTMPWMASCTAGSGWTTRSHAEQALLELQFPMPKGNGIIDQLAVINGLHKEDQRCFDLMATYWRLVLWPVSELVSDKAARKCLLTPAGELPSTLVHINEGDLWELARIANVSIDTAWRTGAVDGSDARRLIAVWLQRHTKDQLHKLRDELNVTEGGSHMGRDELAGCILSAHRSGKSLPVPKRLRSMVKS